MNTKQRLTKAVLKFALCGFAITTLSSCSDGDSAASSKEDELARLTSLPYASWVADTEDSEAKQSIDTKDLPSPGYNLFTFRNNSSACLFDLNYNCIKKWTSSRSDSQGWQFVDIDRAGNLFYLQKQAGTGDGKDGLGKLSKDNKLIWHNTGRYHHEIELLPNGKLITFVSRERITNHKGTEIPFLDDLALVIDSSTGKILEEHSIYDLFREHIRDDQVAKIKVAPWYKDAFTKISNRKEGDAPVIKYDSSGDILHTNSIRLIDRAIENIAAPNDYLISVRQLNAVAIISPDFKKIKWLSKNEFKRQHQPLLLDNDEILVFDNRWKDGFSRVAQMNLKTKKITWQYAAKNPGEFFSATRGGVQRLPNGNTMITISNSGKIIEVSQDGTIVWMFKNPAEKEIKGKKYRAAIYRARRFTPTELGHLFPEVAELQSVAG